MLLSSPCSQRRDDSLPMDQKEHQHSPFVHTRNQNFA
jgi:hypothetical protein